MHPALNLITAAVLLALAYLLFRVRRGWFWRWLNRGADPQRVRTEDSLKHLYHCQEAQQPASLDSLAGALEIPRDMAARLATGLETHGLARINGNRLELTGDGQRYALQVIRTHRLWEQYLAQRTGVDEVEWHVQAEHREHQLTPAEVDRLAAQMGDPLYDPHGDPIPTAAGDLPTTEGVPLASVPSGHVVRVTHVEDEPEEVYRVLLSVGLSLGTVLKVGSWSDQHQQLSLDLRPGTCRLSSLQAANVTVKVLDADAIPETPGRPMSTLALGEAAVVSNILASCQGVERRRLLDLGLVPGTQVHAEMRSPAGDPTAYRIRGALIALRRKQADKILVLTEA